MLPGGCFFRVAGCVGVGHIVGDDVQGGLIGVEGLRHDAERGANCPHRRPPFPAGSRTCGLVYSRRPVRRSRRRFMTFRLARVASSTRAKVAMSPAASRDWRARVFSLIGAHGRQLPVERLAGEGELLQPVSIQTRQRSRCFNHQLFQFRMLTARSDSQHCPLPFPLHDLLAEGRGSRSASSRLLAHQGPTPAIESVLLFIEQRVTYRR